VGPVPVASVNALKAWLPMVYAYRNTYYVATRIPNAACPPRSSQLNHRSTPGGVSVQQNSDTAVSIFLLKSFAQPSILAHLWGTSTL
jgi:hypothetical protein